MTLCILFDEGVGTVATGKDESLYLRICQRKSSEQTQTGDASSERPQTATTENKSPSTLLSDTTTFSKREKEPTLPGECRPESSPTSAVVSQIVTYKRLTEKSPSTVPIMTSTIASTIVQTSTTSPISAQGFQFYLEHGEIVFDLWTENRKWSVRARFMKQLHFWINIAVVWDQQEQTMTVLAKIDLLSLFEPLLTFSI
ncbi:hypothetical protein EG68_04970 [Paragonimus skrjabini miyazakii]|uniref:Uncharacterized protein n=1 Tax=Paragonimus skrjabini miyazakii TaxID=59628 RepID=A0A8S9YSK3_9TREM|nr:hypothetical protein EG68_04970 [Paragonimus skrjabini miyazakii]